MDEMHYQLNLLKAMNQKLSAKENMYYLACNSTEDAFIYYSFKTCKYEVFGKWSEYFDFFIEDQKDLNKLYQRIDEAYQIVLSEVLFPEKENKAKADTECILRDKRIWLSFRTQIIFDNDNIPKEKIVRISNITKTKLRNEELTYFAYYDSITGLYNRNYFVQLLGELIDKAKDNQEIVTVMMVDIDDFHKINDGLGMVVGDEIVQQFASYLKTFCNDNVIACHLNSDIYCLAIYGPDKNCCAESIHKAIKRREREPFILSDGHEVYLTVSIGVAEYPESAQTALELINYSEIVILRCKNSGKNGILYFLPSMIDEFRENVIIENELKDAIARQKFEMYYQPQFYSESGKLRGAEALIRWQDENGQFISPSVFIPIAEKNGSIMPIGNWVVEQSIKQYAHWRNKYGIHFVMSINISAKQYIQDDFVLFLLRILEKYKVKPEEIEIEITESLLIEDFESVSKKLQILQSNGIRISLDDFGTGFSSLSYLKTLPINTLKIDKSFIDTLLTDSATRIITESIVEMVKSLGFESIAEGVEQEQQYKYLNAIGCDVIQGFYLSKPLQAADFETILKQML